MTGPFLSVPLEVALGEVELTVGSGKLPPEAFIKLHLSGFTKLFDLIATKKLNNRDVMVLLVMVSKMELRSNRTRIRASKIAEMLNANVNSVYLSIKRLRDERLIARACDKRTGEIVYMVTPYIFSGGSPKQRGFKIINYNDAIQVDFPDYVPGEVED